MISLPGTLVISQKQGKYGTFNKAKLVTSIGDFTVKDKRIEQYEEGKYDGTFVVIEIKPYSYLYQNRAVYEIQAKLDEMMLNENTRLTEADLTLNSMPEHDPASDELISTPINNNHFKVSDLNADLTKHDDFSLLGDGSKQKDKKVIPDTNADIDEVLFGVFWPLGDEVRLDSTEDRLKLREQTSRLKTLGYQFDYKTQIWSKKPLNHLQNTNLNTLPNKF